LQLVFPPGNQSVEFVIARSKSDEAIHTCFAESRIASLTLAMTGENFSVRHSGAMRSIKPGISRFPDAQLRI